MKRLQGKTAIVTGAGTAAGGIGNGKAAAITFAEEGASVLLVDIDSAAVEETKSLVDAQGGTASTIVADVSDADDCHRVANACQESFGRIDILHNNVGIERPAGLLETSRDDWETTIRINLTSMFLMCREVVPFMAEQGNGAVINVSSINAIRTLPVLSLAYSVSKAGVIALTREVAVEFAERSVRANAILPGMMATPFVTASLAEVYGGSHQRMMEERDQRSPTGKQGESWDVARAAAFLASDEASYISGTTLVVDGGQSVWLR